MKLRQGNSVSTAAITEENFQPIVDAFRMSGCKINAFFNAQNVKYFSFLEWHLDALCKTNEISNFDLLLTVDQILGKAKMPAEFGNQTVYGKKDNAGDWHSRGELPPVESKCTITTDHCGFQFSKSLNGIECEILAHQYLPSGLPVAVFSYVVDDVNFELKYHSLVAECFRPLKTERERAIEEMEKYLLLQEVDCHKTWCGALYDAGYRKGDK